MKTIFFKVPTYSSGVIIHFLNQLKLSAKKSSSEDEGKSSVLEINYPEEKQPIIDELKNILNALIQANLIILMSIKDLLININSKESILNQLFNKPTVNPDLEELCERIMKRIKDRNSRIEKLRAKK